MSRFIKLTSTIINASHITKIVNSSNRYHIYLNNNYMNGFIFMSSGSMSSNDNIIEVCEKENNYDYITVTEWIKNVR